MPETLGTVLAAAVRSLPDSPTPALDAQVLLGHVFGKPRAWVLAHGEETVREPQRKRFTALLARRRATAPIAYLTGQQEFYGRQFVVAPDVLIPRPESEQLVELALAELRPNDQLYDVGTGSGCLAITLKLERPEVAVLGSDTSPAALGVAQRNAAQLTAEVEWVETDLCPPLSDPTRTVVVANLPYVPTEEYRQSSSIQSEPAQALDGGSDGYRVIERLLQQLDDHAPRILLLEIDPSQAERLRTRYGERSRIIPDLAGADRFAVITS